MRLVFGKQIMRSDLARALGSIVVGRVAGSTAGPLPSGGDTDQLPLTTVPAAIVTLFARSFPVVSRGRS